MLSSLTRSSGLFLLKMTFHAASLFIEILSLVPEGPNKSYSKKYLIVLKTYMKAFSFICSTITFWNLYKKYQKWQAWLQWPHILLHLLGDSGQGWWSYSSPSFPQELCLVPFVEELLKFLINMKSWLSGTRTVYSEVVSNCTMASNDLLLLGLLVPDGELSPSINLLSLDHIKW